MKKAFRINKIEKFLLHENPMRNENEHLNRVFILHTREPAMLIQIHWMSDLRESLDLTSADICNVSTMIEDEEGNESELIFRTIFLYDDNFEDKEKLEDIVKAAVDWYLAYLSGK